MFKKVITKYLNDQCNEKELQEVMSFINDEELIGEHKDWLAEEWKNYKVEGRFDDDEKFGKLFIKIINKINTKGNDRKTSINSSRRTIYLKSFITKAAAILLLPVLTFLFYTLSEFHDVEGKLMAFMSDTVEIVAPIGSRTVLQLSDGSVVHLNYGSKIKYPRVFAGDTRDVKLEGEGFFKVKHDPNHPFIVNTGKLNIKALGTSFNVNAYPDDEGIETTLIEGKVVLEQINDAGKAEIIGSMVPDQHVDYTKSSGRLLSSFGDMHKYVDWKDGKLVFEDTSILDIAEKLSRMYNVDIQVSDAVKDYQYTVTFIDEPLFQILDLMTVATPVGYKAFPRKKTDSGTYTKLKIVIE